MAIVGFPMKIPAISVYQQVINKDNHPPIRQANQPTESLDNPLRRKGNSA
jgi:hypothetical protein